MTTLQALHHRPEVCGVVHPVARRRGAAAVAAKAVALAAGPRGAEAHEAAHQGAPRPLERIATGLLSGCEL